VLGGPSVISAENVLAWLVVSKELIFITKFQLRRNACRLRKRRFSRTASGRFAGATRDHQLRRANSATLRAEDCSMIAAAR
jgi:hypothetical protein